VVVIKLISGDDEIRGEGGDEVDVMGVKEELILEVVVEFEGRWWCI